MTDLSSHKKKSERADLSDKDGLAIRRSKKTERADLADKDGLMVGPEQKIDSATKLLVVEKGSSAVSSGVQGKFANLRKSVTEAAELAWRQYCKHDPSCNVHSASICKCVQSEKNKNLHETVIELDHEDDASGRLTTRWTLAAYERTPGRWIVLGLTDTTFTGGRGAVAGIQRSWLEWEASLDDGCRNDKDKEREASEREGSQVSDGRDPEPGDESASNKPSRVNRQSVSCNQQDEPNRNDPKEQTKDPASIDDASATMKRQRSTEAMAGTIGRTGRVAIRQAG